MPAPDKPEQGGSPEPAAGKSQRSSFPTTLAWIAVGLTLLFGFAGSGDNWESTWILVGLALASVGFSSVAVFRTRNAPREAWSLSAGFALSVSMFVLFGSIVGVFVRSERDRSVRHFNNRSKLTSLELMLAIHYQETNEYPEDLPGLRSEAQRSFGGAAIDDFLGYIDPRTADWNPWIYERTGINECTIKSEPYRFKGRRLILVLRGSGEEFEVKEEDVK